MEAVVSIEQAMWRDIVQRECAGMWMDNGRSARKFLLESFYWTRIRIPDMFDRC
jgi:hypothetical protein